MIGACTLQDASILSSAVDAAKLRAHTAARSSSRKMLQSSMSEADMEKLMCANP